jgi:6-phosphogluconolactonase (cycloisomerase 2 family)
MMTGLQQLGACVLVCMSAADASAERRFVYTNNDVNGPNTVTALRVETDGTLVPLPESPYDTGGTGAGGGLLAASRIAVQPGGDTLFVANGGSNDISAFRIDAASGGLTAVPGSPFPSGGRASFGTSLGATPDGRYLIAVNAGSANIVVFRIGANGALTPTPASPYWLRSIPDGIKVSPNGRFLAISLTESNLIDVFRIGPGGELARVEGGPFPASMPAGLEINCTSDRLFAGEAVSGTGVEVFAMSARGSLAPMPGSPFHFASGSFADVVTLNPVENVLFVSNKDTATVTVLRVNRAGALTLVPGSPFVVGAAVFPGGIGDPTLFPGGMATDRVGRFLYVADLTGEVTVFRVQPDASLAPVAGSPFTTGQPSGLISLAAYPAKSCTLPVTIEILGRPIGRGAEKHGKVRVAVSAGFDADLIDARRVMFEGASPVKVASVARNRDRRGDLVFTFDADALDIAPGSTSACIFGTLTSGHPFSGCAALREGR